MSLMAFSPSGELLAVAGHNGYIHLVDWKSGAGQVIDSLKCASGGDGGCTGCGGMLLVQMIMSRC
jgi:U3 small nucleolar RNA-associated protein 18